MRGAQPPHFFYKAGVVAVKKIFQRVFYGTEPASGLYDLAEKGFWDLYGSHIPTLAHSKSFVNKIVVFWRIIKKTPRGCGWRLLMRRLSSEI